MTRAQQQDKGRAKHERPPFSMVPHWLAQARPTGIALKTYIALASFANNDTREAYPARRTLANWLGVSVRQVARGLDELESLGAVRIDSHGGPGAVNLYTLLMRTNLSPIEDKSVTRGRTNLSSGVGQICPVDEDKSVTQNYKKELDPKELDPKELKNRLVDLPIDELYRFDDFWKEVARKESMSAPPENCRTSAGRKMTNPAG